MADRTVLIIGASARAAAQSAKRAGWNVVASDMFGDVDLREVADFVPIRNYPHDFAEVIANHPKLPVIYTGGLENHADLLQTPRAVLGNRGEPLRRSRDVFDWTRLLRAAGFVVAEVRSWAEPPPVPSDWLLKSFRSAGGGGVRYGSDPHVTEADFFQRRIHGETLAAVFVESHGRAELFGVTRQLTGLSSLNAAPFAYCGSAGPVEPGSITRSAMAAIGGLVVEELGLRGVFGIDFMVRADGIPVPIEINPRYTASVEVLELATARSVFADKPEHYSGDAQVVSAPFAIKVIAYAAADHTAGGLPRGTVQDGAWLADVPQPGAVIQCGEPVCSVLALGADRVDAVATATSELRTIDDLAGLSVDAVGRDLLALRAG